MSCGCGKKKNGVIDAAMEREANQLLPPTQWGPIFWKYLHIIAEKVGQSGSKLMDTDQANYTTTLITMLPSIIPCPDCQNHSEAYLAANPFPSLKDAYGAALRATIRQWLFNFHNHVRIMKEQIPLGTVEECTALYAAAFVSRAEYTILTECIAAATRQNWVRLPQWKKWYSVSERLRLLSGNMIN